MIRDVLNKFTFVSFPLVGNPSEDKDINKKDSEPILDGARTRVGMTYNLVQS